MEIAMIGLGKMGMNMARRLLKGGHKVFAYNRTPEKAAQIEKEGAQAAADLESLIKKMNPPRTVWMMLPSGDAIDQMIENLIPLLSSCDILIDGGNSYFKDDLKRSDILSAANIHYVDAGVSGGIWGLENGYCIMIGGKFSDFKQIEPVLKTLAPPDGYLYCGGVGAGHYVKMAHNGIEYALMEGYGEGFELLRYSPYGENLDLRAVAKLWNRGSVIRSWLLELLEEALKEDISKIQGYVEDSGEGRWAVQTAIEYSISAPAMAAAVFKRYQSRQKDLFSDKIIAVLRDEFGGHGVHKKP